MKLPSIMEGSRRGLFGRLILNGIAQAVVVVAMALVMRDAFDHLISARVRPDVDSLLHYLGAFSMIVIAGAWLRWRERVDAEHFGQDYVFDLRQQLFAHMSRISPRALQRRSRGGIMLRFVGDLTALRQWISLGVARLAVATVATAGTLVALTWVNLSLGLLVGVLLLLTSLVMLALGGALEVSVRGARKQRSRLAANISEKIAAMSVVQAFGQRQRERRLLKRQSAALREAMIHRADFIGQLRAAIELMVGFASAGILLLGAWEISLGQATPGTVVAAMLVMSMLAPPLRDLGRVHEYWRGAKVSREKIVQFLSERGRVWQRRKAPSLEVERGVVEFSGVSIAGAIHDFSARAGSGDRVALVGPNGAGKSTLLSLAARLFDPDAGEILIDGQNIAHCSLQSVRRNIGMAGPDLPLLRGSVERNLKYRCPQASREDIQALNQFCGIEQLAKDLPQGLRTRLADGGINLSVGQRARIGLARAMLGTPPILLLDEVESNLDADAAVLIDRILEHYPGTILMVTHRPDYLDRMTQVWRLDSRDDNESVSRDTALMLVS